MGRTPHVTAGTASRASVGTAAVRPATSRPAAVRPGAVRPAASGPSAGLAADSERRPPPSSGGGYGIWIVVAVVLVLLVAGGVVVGYVMSDDDTDAGPHDHVSGSEPASAPESESTPAETTTEPVAPPSDQFGIALGPEDAEDTIVVYEDLLCPPCARLHAVSDPLVQGARNGEFRLVVRFVNYLSRYGTYSADAANAVFVTRKAAGDEVAFALQSLLLEQQPAQTGPYPDTEWLIARAVEAGAAEAAVRPGIEDRAESGAVLKADVFARGNEVPAVPDVVVNDQPVTADGDPSNLVQAAIRATQR